VPQVDVDDTLLAEESFREMLAALDFRATFEPARNELRMRARLAPELLPRERSLVWQSVAKGSEEHGQASYPWGSRLGGREWAQLIAFAAVFPLTPRWWAMAESLRPSSRR